MEWCFLIIILLSSVAIAVQDLRSRMISLWLILLFTLGSTGHYLYQHSLGGLLENMLFCLGYFVLCYAVLHLYYFLRTRKFQRLLDRKIGWGDVLLLLAIGCCLQPEDLLIFFTASFLLSALLHLLVFRHHHTIALGAFLVSFYSLYLVYMRFMTE
jgi:Flp pilus assembly protein protease CpaA